jgi:D-alanyl-D-alanine carboxypeptidase-like protein
MGLRAKTQDLRPAATTGRAAADVPRPIAFDGIGNQWTNGGGYRTPEKQKFMVDNNIGITPASNSLHKAGLAVDVNFPKEAQSVIRNAAERAGLSWGGTFTPTDPVHFYFDPIPNQDRTELINYFTEQVRRIQSRR